LREAVEAFRFVKNVTDYRVDSGFVARIPLQIGTVSQLLNVFYETLQFPGYFGFNWDALSDCLRDLHWLNEQSIVILHEELPKLNDRELRIYLKVLVDAVADWKPGEEHCLIVVCSELEREKIDELLSF